MWPMVEKTKRKTGRNPLPGGRANFGTTLPQYVIDYLKKDGNASAKIIELVDADVRKTSQSSDNQG
jgi:hypothetical protein